MSDINLGFTVASSNINVVLEPNDITFTPTDINLTITTGGVALPGGTSGQLQYNNGGVLGGVANTLYSAGNLSLGNVANVKITGGTNGYVLQTDGTGNLTWTNAPTANAGNGIPGGSNTQIQYNDSGLFGGTAGFTFDEVTGNVNIPGNLIVATNISGNVISTVANANYSAYSGNVVLASQPNITALGTLLALNVGGTTSIQQAIEKVTSNATGSTGTVNFDLLNQAILYKTANATNNFTINIRGNGTTQLNSVVSSNQSITCTYLNTNGATGYYANVIQVDGNTVTPKWIVNGTPVTGTATGIDAYTFNIVKTAAHTYTVLASKVGFA